MTLLPVTFTYKEPRFLSGKEKIWLLLYSSVVPVLHCFFVVIEHPPGHDDNLYAIYILMILFWSLYAFPVYFAVQWIFKRESIKLIHFVSDLMIGAPLLVVFPVTFVFSIMSVVFAGILFQKSENAMNIAGIASMIMFVYASVWNVLSVNIIVLCMKKNKKETHHCIDSDFAR